MPSFSREEIQSALDNYAVVADQAAKSGDWAPWAELFTEDVTYVEHLYGEFHGREEVLTWISKTMGAWPLTQMNAFPWDWHTIDAEQGWVVGQIENRFADPGDGKVYQAANWTRLVYAGNGLFSSEEDVYNPMRFQPVVEGWLAAWQKHHPDQPNG
jgi:SnoaL-like protein